MRPFRSRRHCGNGRSAGEIAHRGLTAQGGELDFSSLEDTVGARRTGIIVVWRVTAAVVEVAAAA